MREEYRILPFTTKMTELNGFFCSLNVLIALGKELFNPRRISCGEKLDMSRNLSTGAKREQRRQNLDGIIGSDHRITKKR